MLLFVAMNIYYLIDESGDVGYTRKSSKFFILTGLAVGDINPIRLIAKKVHLHKKDKKKQNGLHAYSETIQIKNKITKMVKKLNICCYVKLVDKEKIKLEDAYLYALGEFIKFISAIKAEHNVIIARKDTRKSYNQNICNIFIKNNIVIKLTDPVKEKALQIADFYSWAIFSHIENHHSIYFNALKHQIVFI